MKNIAEIRAEEYGMMAAEIMVAGAMKLYIQSMEPREALRKVAAVYEPKVIRLDSGEAVPVQSIIDGAKYAAFIDEAVMFAAQGMKERGDELAGRVEDELKTVDGKHMIESASVELMSFIEDAYRCRCVPMSEKLVKFAGKFTEERLINERLYGNMKIQ